MTPSQKPMNGAESLVYALTASGIDTCFTNPGTSEMHIVAALDRIPKMRCVLGLFEGVVTGAADGYARMSGKPACTLLHLGPGLANGLANLHNASRAHVPIVNIVGQHASDHLQYDTPLTSDIEGIARPYSAWLRTSTCASQVGSDAAEAVFAARTAPGRIATLIVPADAAWGEAGPTPVVQVPPAVALPSAQRIEHAAEMLRSGKRTALVLSGGALIGEGLTTAGRIAAATNTKLLAPYPFARMERGAGRPVVERIPYVLEQAVEFLKEFGQMILVGAQPPVAYFAYPDKTSVMTSPECEIHVLTRPEEDGAGALRTLAGFVRAKSSSQATLSSPRPSVPSGEITLNGLATAVAAVLPENAIVIDESMTSGRTMIPATAGAPPHDWLVNTGGSIGIAMPLALGAAVASTDRPVLCLSADGSGMYTAQALWSMARENLPVTTVIFANRAYGVLQREFSYLGVGPPGPRASRLFDIGHPDLDWTSLSRGMGVPATRVRTLEEFADSLRAGFASRGPNLIEVHL